MGKHSYLHVQNVTDFSQSKLDSEINALFLLNEHGDLRIFFKEFSKNSQINWTYLKKKKVW